MYSTKKREKHKQRSERKEKWVQFVVESPSTVAQQRHWEIILRLWYLLILLVTIVIVSSTTFSQTQSSTVWGKIRHNAGGIVALVFLHTTFRRYRDLSEDVDEAARRLANRDAEKLKEVALVSAPPLPPQ